MMDLQAIHGIDFSGAQDAGNRIWMAKGGQESETFPVSECFRARDLPTASGLP